MQAEAVHLPANLGELSELDVMNVFGIVKKEFNIDPKRTFLAGQSMGARAIQLLVSEAPTTARAAILLAPVPLTGMPRRAVHLVIRVTLTNHRTVVSRRTYHPCTARTTRRGR